MSNNTTPMVSVVMSVFNGERYLSEALDSIFNQTLRSFELILIDDASTDSTPHILDNYSQPNLIRLTNPENLGLTRSLNKGLEAARGDYIARHDADDVSHPDRLQRQLDLLLSNSKIGLVGTSYSVIDQHGHILDIARPPTTDEQLRKSLERGNIFCHGSVMMRRDILEIVGRYHEYFHVTQDYDLWLRISEHSEIANLDEVLYKFRFDSESVTRKKRDLQLAYLQFARHLAEQRSTGQIEGPMPDDVLSAYPPEPFRRYGDARWAAYLFYATGNKTQAKKYILHALEIQDHHQFTPPSAWSEWTIARASELASLRDNPQLGAEFMTWVFRILSVDKGQESQQAIANFFANQAFLAHQVGLKKRVLSCTLKAFRHDLSWVTNRGLWVISWKSLLN